MKPTQGIYKIENRITKQVYIGASSNIPSRFNNHMNAMMNGNHRNKRLNESVEEYGFENFIFSVVSYQPDLTREELIKIEECVIASYDREQLYNMQYKTNGGGADALSKETYLLDLEGNIIRVFESTNDCYKENGHKIGDYRNLNTDAILSKKYRVVTREFYENNYDTVKSWKPFSNFNEIVKEYYNFMRPLQVEDLYTEEVLIFDSITEIAVHFGVTNERIRQCKVANRPFRKRYLITNLNNKEDFYAYEWLSGAPKSYRGRYKM